MPYVLYIASASAAVALFMMMPRRRYTPAKLGALLGAVTLGALWLYLAKHYLTEFGGDEVRGLARPAMVYYYLFSAIAIGAAARVITHTKPVYAALWFVMVVLASAGLLLLLSAEFMAVAMVIIYGGAILVTYLFVLMLASHAGDPADVDEAPVYDRVAREPAAASGVGFLLLATLLATVFAGQADEPFRANPKALGATDSELVASELPQRAAARLVERAEMQNGVSPVAPGQAGQLDNAERIGLDLFRAHPLGVELAGVILTVSLIGAVVIARTRVDLSQESEEQQ